MWVSDLFYMLWPWGKAMEMEEIEWDEHWGNLFQLGVCACVRAVCGCMCSVCVHMHTYVCACVFVHVCMGMHVPTCVCMRTSERMYVCVHACVCVCLSV